MEQPDFKIEGESRYPIRSSGKIYSIRKAFRAGCEHVWNTHVVPLQEENQRLKNDLLDALDLKEGKGPTALSMAISENKALREENTRLTTKFIEEEHAADHPNENLSYWQYQQFTRAAITKLKEEIERLKAELKNANSALDNISDMGHA